MYFSRIRIRKDIFKNTQLSNVIYDNIYSKHRLFWDLFPGLKNRNFLYREEIAREQLGSNPQYRGEPIYYFLSKTKPRTDNPLFQVEVRDFQPKFSNGDRLKFELRANPVVTKNGKKHDVVMHSQKTFLESLCNELNFQSYVAQSSSKGDLKKILLEHGSLSLDSRLTALLKDDYRYSERLDHKMSLSEKLEWSIKAKIDHSLDQWLTRQGRETAFEILKDQYGQLKLQTSAYQWHELTQKSRRGKKSGFCSVDFTGDIEITDADFFKEKICEGIGRSKAFGCGLMLLKRI